MRYVLAINIGRQYTDRCDATVIARNVRSTLTAHGFGFRFDPQFRVQVTPSSGLDVFSLSPARGTAVISLAVDKASFSPADIAEIDSVCLNAIFASAQAPRGSTDWMVSGILSRLPSNGSGSARLAIIGRNGEPTEIVRDVASGMAPPVPQATNPVLSQVVAQTNEPNGAVGQPVPSGVSNAAMDASDAMSRLWSENRTAIITGGVVIGLVATAVIVVEVKGALK